LLARAQEEVRASSPVDYYRARNHDYVTDRANKKTPFPSMPENGELFYNLAAAFGFVAYLLTNILWLRILLVIGACCYIATGIILGLTSMIGWHMAYAMINLVHIVLIIMDRSVRSLPPAIRDLYHSRFIALRPREFVRLLKINKEIKTEQTTLLVEGEHNDKLYLITGGEVIVRKHGREVSRRGPGEFIGEMSVLTGEPASSDVVVLDSARYAYWSTKDLKRLEAKNLTLYNRFMMIVGQNLVEKLRHLTHSGFADKEASAEANE
jgi:CRP-like cAMP-binding protein